MYDAVDRGRPDLVVHLGDGERDVANLSARFPDVPINAVCGNCDAAGGFPESMEFSVYGVKCFITHGHLYGVKYSPDRLLYAGEERSAQIVMFGHTHRAGVSEIAGMTLINPGSCGYPPRTFAELDIAEDGVYSCRIMEL